MVVNLRTVHYEEICEQVDAMGQTERLSLLAHILSSADSNFLIPSPGWALTRQGPGYDVLTVNVSGSVANMHAPGTISFKETKMPRSKLGGTLFYDMENK